MRLIERDEIRFKMTKFGFAAPDMTIHEFVEDELDPADPVHAAGGCYCRECKYAKPVVHRGEIIDGIYRCSKLKPNTDMFDIDFCRYGKPKEAQDDE